MIGFFKLKSPTRNKTQTLMNIEEPMSNITTFLPFLQGSSRKSNHFFSSEDGDHITNSMLHDIGIKSYRSITL
jgi:hypothetical protein